MTLFPWNQDVGSAEGSRTLKMRADFLLLTLAGTGHFCAGSLHRWEGNGKRPSTNNPALALGYHIVIL